MSQVSGLRTLQDLDDEAATLRASLEDVQRRLQGSEELDAARSTFASTQAGLADARRTQRQLDGEIGILNSRIVPEEKRLYDGSVRNPKELGNIQHEVELLKAQRATLEDQLLELMAGIETFESAHAAAEKALLRAEADWETRSSALREEETRLAASLTGAEARREAHRSGLPPRALHLYDDIRRRRGGMAVAHVQGSMCAGCRVSVPESVRRRAFQPDQLAQCPNCERILYVG